MKNIKRFIIGALIIISSVASVPVYAWTNEVNGWIDGTKGWSYMKNNTYVDGWNYIDDNWYYFYKDTNFMAHDTIIDGCYLNSDGIWTNDIPEAINQIIKNDIIYLNYTLENIEWNFYTQENVSFKDLCNGYWDVPDIYGDVYWIKHNNIDYMGYFVSENDIYSLGNQGGTYIYKIENGKIVQQIPYNNGSCYNWRVY